MIRALQAAFWLRYPVRGLGNVPLNLVGLTCLGLLGFGNAGFWFAGLGLETIYLASLATNPRFQRYARAQELIEQGVDVEAKRHALLQQLPHVDKLAIERLSAKCRRIESIQSHDDVVLQSRRCATCNGTWLLLARWHVLAATPRPINHAHADRDTGAGF